MEMDSWNSARLREDFEEQARMKRMSSRIRQRIGRAVYGFLYCSGFAPFHADHYG